MYEQMREHYEDAGTRYDYYSEGGFEDVDIFPYDPEPHTLAEKIDWKLICLREKIERAVASVVPYVIGRNFAGRLAYLFCFRLTKTGIRLIRRHGKPSDDARCIQIGPVKLVVFDYFNMGIDVYINDVWLGDFSAHGFDQCPF